MLITTPMPATIVAPDAPPDVLVESEKKTQHSQSYLQN